MLTFQLVGAAFVLLCLVPLLARDPEVRARRGNVLRPSATAAAWLGSRMPFRSSCQTVLRKFMSDGAAMDPNFGSAHPCFNDETIGEI
jgi:hypothetical protein